MVLFKTWPFFQVFFLGNIDQENVFYDILEGKTLFQATKTRSSKSQKIDIFPKGLVNPWVWFKNGDFSNFCFRQYRPGKCLLRYSRTKNRLSRLRIQIPWGDTHFVQFKEEKRSQLGPFSLERNRNFVYHKDFYRRRAT